MLDWIKNINKEYPKFWKEYLSKFDKKSERFVVLNLETTGFDPQHDKILSIGAVAVENGNIIVNDFFEAKLNQTENTVIEDFIKYISNSVLIGHRINFDIEILNTTLENLHAGRLKNEALDIEIMHQKLNMTNKNFSIDDLVQHYNISKTYRLSTAEESFLIALLFLKLKQRLKL